MQGSHPEGTESRRSTHILGGEQTIAADQGLFLGRDLAPAPGDLRLHVRAVLRGSAEARRAGLERQEIRSSAAGPRVPGCASSPCSIDGNQNSSPEEAEVIRASSPTSCDRSTSWIDREGAEQAGAPR